VCDCPVVSRAERGLLGYSLWPSQLQGVAVPFLPVVQAGGGALLKLQGQGQGPRQSQVQGQDQGQGQGQEGVRVRVKSQW
jgi:hypothetical protein